MVLIAAVDGNDVANALAEYFRRCTFTGSRYTTLMDSLRSAGSTFNGIEMYDTLIFPVLEPIDKKYGFKSKYDAQWWIVRASN